MSATSPCPNRPMLSERERRLVDALKSLDGLSYRNNSVSLPHPVDLAEWWNACLYTIDSANDCFRLTPKARALIREMTGEG